MGHICCRLRGTSDAASTCAKAAETRPLFLGCALSCLWNLTCREKLLLFDDLGVWLGWRVLWVLGYRFLLLLLRDLLGSRRRWRLLLMVDWERLGSGSWLRGLDVKVINIIVVNNVCYTGLRWGRSLSLIKVLLLLTLRQLLLIHMARWGCHEWGLAYVSCSVRKVRRIVNLCSQLVRGWLFTWLLKLMLLHELARHHRLLLLGWLLDVFWCCISFLLVHQVLLLMQIVAQHVVGTWLSHSASLLGDLRCRVEGGAKLIKVLSHHFCTCGQRDRIRISGLCERHRLLSSYRIGTFLRAKVTILGKRLHLALFHFVRVSLHYLVAFALVKLSWLGYI